LADYTRVIELDPTNAQAYLFHGVICAKLRRFEEALTDFTHAITLNPASVPAYASRGRAYATLGCYDEALIDFTRAIELDPTNAQAYVYIGALLTNQSKPREALPYFEKAAQLGDPDGARGAAVARQQLGMEGVAPAQQAFNAMMQAGSLYELRQTVAQFSLMTGQEFIQAVEQVITQQVPPEHKPAAEQRLDWLKQIANEQQ
jgi:tetratricopeptide (TPR) repeat protein